MIAFSGLASGFAGFPDDVEAAFATLSPIQQRWLSLHAKETTFTWTEGDWGGRDKGWLPGEASRLFEELRSFVESRGMKLIRRRSML